MNMIERQTAEAQRLDRYYYAVADRGYDSTTGEKGKGALQRYAARRSKQTRARLFAMISAALKEE